MQVLGNGAVVLVSLLRIVFSVEVARGLARVEYKEAVVEPRRVCDPQIEVEVSRFPISETVHREYFELGEIRTEKRY